MLANRVRMVSGRGGKIPSIPILLDAEGNYANFKVSENSHGSYEATFPIGVGAAVILSASLFFGGDGYIEFVSDILSINSTNLEIEIGSVYRSYGENIFKIEVDDTVIYESDDRFDYSNQTTRIDLSQFGFKKGDMVTLKITMETFGATPYDTFEIHINKIRW